jgi:hypothetical protein
LAKCTVATTTTVTTTKFMPIGFVASNIEKDLSD